MARRHHRDGKSPAINCLTLPAKWVGRTVKRVKRRFKRGFVDAISPKCKSRKRSRPPTVETTEKTASPPSPSVTTTTASPQQSPVAPPPPPFPPLPHADLKFAEPTQPASPIPQTPSATPSPVRDPLTSIGSGNTPTPHPGTLKTSPDREKQPAGPDPAPANFDLDNLDKIFEEAMESGNDSLLADGTPIPWTKGKSSPSTAFRYLDDIQNGLEIIPPLEEQKL